MRGYGETDRQTDRDRDRQTYREEGGVINIVILAIIKDDECV